MEGADDLMDLNMDGDWTVRGGASNESLIKSLEFIAQKETGRMIHIEQRTVERPVWVMSGKLPVTFNGKPSPRLEIYAENQDGGKGGLGGGNIQDFTKWIANWLKVRVVNDVSNDSRPTYFDWRIHSDSEEWNMGNRRDELLPKVLKNLESQTGLSLSQEKRMVSIWFVTEEK